MEAAVRIENLSVVLGKHFAALRNINLELPAGKIIGFIGPSGAGKTTLIRSIVGSQKLTSGHIEIFGMPAGARSLRATVTYMPQELSVYPDLTVQENLRYFAAIRGVSSEALAEILELVDLTDRLHHLVSNLSTGQKQRVSLAVALIGLPKLMVLDEPTVGLDPVLRARLWDVFRELASRGMTLLISSHSMDEASRCEDLVLIRDGTVIAHDAPEEFLRKTKASSIEEGFIRLVEKKG